MKKAFLLVFSMFYFLNSNAQAVGGWGTCEFATLAAMNAFDPSSDDNHCKKVYVKATNEHYKWDGSQWVQENAQNIYNANGTLDANRTVNLSGSSLTFDGTQDIIFEADGDVGIGTIAPEAKLDVNGVSLLRNGADWRGGGNGQLQFGHNGTTNYRHVIKSRHDNSVRYNSLDFYIWQHGVDTIKGLGSLEVMSISGRNSGSVGIGTQNPDAKLQVSGGDVRFSDYGVGTYDDASPAKILGVKADGSIVEVNLASNGFQDNLYTINGTLGADRTVNMSSNDLSFTGSGDYRFRSSGNFGIGTAVPEAKLDVNGISLLRNGSDWRPTGDGQIQFGSRGTTNYRHVIKSRHDNSNRYNSLDFYVWQHGVDAIDALGTLEVMTVSSRNSGSVGIGTQNPDAKLQVSGGDVRFSDYGVGTYDVVSPARLLGVNATGNIVEFSLSSSNLSDNIYNTNGTLTANRTVTMGSNDLTLNGSGDLTFNSSGNVGIGTVSAGAKLDLDGFTLLRNGSDWRATGNGQIQFSRDGTTNRRHVIKSRHNSGNSYNALDFYIWQDGVDTIGGLASSQVLSVSGRNSGSVGIGTLNPEAKLEVSGGKVRFSDYGSGTHDDASPARILGVQADGDIVEFSLSSSNLNDNFYNINGTLTANRTVTMGSNDLTLNGSGDYTFNSSGNFGIGTASGGAKLDVNGVSLLRNGSDWRPTGDGQIQFGRAGTGQRRHVIKSKHHGTNDAYNSLDFYLWHVADSDADDLGTLNVMTVSARNSGSVGIGTLAPAAKLEVSGGGVIFSDYGTGTHNDASPAKLLGVKSTGEVVEMNLSASALQDNVYNINGTLTSDRTVTMGSNDFSLTGSGDYRFRSSGNFGIGTVTPTAKLDVTGIMLLRNGSDWRPSGNGQIQFSRDGTADRRHVIKSRHQPGNNYNGLDFYIWEDGTDAVGDLGSRHAMSVTGRNSGSVGIGTVNPNAKLEVSGGKVRFSDYGTGTHDEASPARLLGVKSDGDVVEVVLPSFNSLYSTNGTLSANRTIAMGGRNLTFDGSADVAILNNGNVGIGTTNPTSAKLEVNATGSSSGLHIDTDHADRSLLTFRRTNNAHEIGLAFQNSGNAHGSAIFHRSQSDASLPEALTIASVGNPTAASGLGATATFKNGGDIRFHSYGIGTYDDASPARILGVQADGDIVEIAPADLFMGNTNEQRKNTLNENIQTTDHWLSNDGEDEGVYISPNGNVGVGTKKSDALFSVGDGKVAFENYGKGANAKGTDTYMISVDADGNLQEMNTAKNARVFYPPAVPIDISGAGEGTLNLYKQYQELFTRPVVSSPDAKGIPIPSYRANELHYYITDYDTSVFSDVAISNAGVLTYTVTRAGLGDFSSMNVVFVVK